jgi:hypothetical protein
MTSELKAARRLAQEFFADYTPGKPQTAVDLLEEAFEWLQDRTIGPVPDKQLTDVVERVARDVIVHNRQMVGDEADYAYADAILVSDDAGDAGEAYAARELVKVVLASLNTAPAGDDVRLLREENARLSKAVCSGVLNDLLTEDETEALVEFVKELRARAAIKATPEEKGNG